MANRILLTTAAALALTVSACNRSEAGAEKEKNKTEETGNSSAQKGERPTGNESASPEEENGGEEEGRERNTDEAGDTASAGGGEEFGSRLRGAGGSSGSSGSSGGSAAELRAALQEAAREQQARLPLRDGITTVYDVEAQGTEFIVSLRVSQDLTTEQFDRLQDAFRRNTCSGDSAGLIRMGATTTYRVTDSAGERRSFSYDSC
jgi:hypothetical protein